MYAQKSCAHTLEVDPVLQPYSLYPSRLPSFSSPRPSSGLMPPKRKKTAATAKKATAKKKAKPESEPSSSSSVSSSNNAGSLATPEEIYDRFADPERDNEAITLEGISNICELVGLDAGTDIRALFMCWKLGSKEKPGEFTRDEFVGGMNRLGTQSIDDLKKKLPLFDPGFLDGDEYKDFFRWTFQFNLEGTKKTLEQEVVIELLPLAISDRSRFTKKFLEFLPTSNVSRISVSLPSKALLLAFFPALLRCYS